MFALIDWLRAHIPSEDSSGVTAGLVHGDFRIDNLIFHPSEVCDFFYINISFEFPCPPFCFLLVQPRG